MHTGTSLIRLAATLLVGCGLMPLVSAWGWRRAERLAGATPSAMGAVCAAGLGPMLPALALTWVLYLWPGLSPAALLGAGLLAWGVLVLGVARPWRALPTVEPALTRAPPKWPLVLALPFVAVAFGQNLLYPIVENDAAFLRAQGARLAMDRDYRQLTDGPDPTDGFLSPRYPLGTSLLHAALLWGAGGGDEARAIQRVPSAVYLFFVISAVYAAAFEFSGSVGWSAVGMLLPLTARTNMGLWLTNQKEPILQFLLLVIFVAVWQCTRATEAPRRRLALGLLCVSVPVYAVSHESANFVLVLVGGLLVVLRGPRRGLPLAALVLGAGLAIGAVPHLVERIAQARYAPGDIWQMTTRMYSEALLPLVWYHKIRGMPYPVWLAAKLGPWSRPVLYSPLFWLFLVLPWLRESGRRIEPFDIAFAGPSLAMWFLCADPLHILERYVMYAPVLYLFGKYQMLLLPLGSVWAAVRLHHVTNSTRARWMPMGVALVGCAGLACSNLDAGLKGPLWPPAHAWRGEDERSLIATAYNVSSVHAARVADRVMGAEAGRLLTFDPARTYLFVSHPTVSIYDRRVDRLFDMTSPGEVHRYLWDELGVTHVLGSGYHFVPANGLWHRTPLKTVLANPARATLVYHAKDGLIYALRPPKPVTR